MVNYYAELGLDPGASLEELQTKLKSLRRTWTTRASTAADPEKRQQAERKVALIREATEILLDADKRKSYDKKLEKSGSSSAAPQPEFEAPSAASTSFMDNAALMDMLESCYENSRYNQAISAANRLLDNGVVNVDVYRYLVQSYVEKGDESKAYQCLKRIENSMPDDPDALLLISQTLLRLLPGHEAEARVYLDKLIDLGYGEESEVASLDIEYQIDSGNMDVADQKYNAFISGNGKDTNFCMNVANAYVQAANRNATEYAGDFYFDKPVDFKNFSTLVEKANSIYPFEGNVELLKELKKTTMIPEWWIGVVCFLLYAFAGFSVNPLIGILCLAGAVVLFYYSRVPNWMAIRFAYKNHLCGIYEVMRILNFIFSIWWRVAWAIMKVVFGAVLAFM